jgi:hypothetical protein
VKLSDPYRDADVFPNRESGAAIIRVARSLEKPDVVVVNAEVVDRFPLTSEEKLVMLVDSCAAAFGIFHAEVRRAVDEILTATLLPPETFKLLEDVLRDAEAINVKPEPVNRHERREAAALLRRHVPARRRY